MFAARNGFRRVVLCTILASPLLLAGCRAPGRVAGFPKREPVRAIWVTRWDYKNPRDIATVMRNCREAGFNTVLFQVRGAGTVFYPSRIEPWAEELGGRDPGFDPLAVACREAHRQGLAIHAWVNVMPAWRGKGPPADRRHVFHRHPEWFLIDAQGRRQPFGWYQSVNPCLPEVRKYLVAVMHEIVRNYPVDGLHLDYIRFPIEHSPAWPAGAKMPDYPRDPRTLALFRQETGRTPEQAQQLWTQWRNDQVTRLVADIRRMMKDVKPKAGLSAAVGHDPDGHYRKYYQDSRRWMERGLVDAVMPMNYTGSVPEFGKRVERWAELRGRTRVVMGVNLDEQQAEVGRAQIELARRQCRDFVIFAYNALWERLDATGRPVGDAQSPRRAERLRQMMPYLRHLAAQDRGARY